jgi:hypothetical protein
MEKILSQFLDPKMMEALISLTEKLALLFEVLPPIDIKKLKIQNKEYIAVLIEVKKQ